MSLRLALLVSLRRHTFFGLAQKKYAKKCASGGKPPDDPLLTFGTCAFQSWGSACRRKQGRVRAYTFLCGTRDECAVRARKRTPFRRARRKTCLLCAQNKRQKEEIFKRNHMVSLKSPFCFFLAIQKEGPSGRTNSLQASRAYLYERRIMPPSKVTQTLTFPPFCYKIQG